MPRRIVDRNVSAEGRRIAYGTYQLDPDPEGRTEITFHYALAAAPVVEQLLASVIRRVMRRALSESMRRLHDHLAAGSYLPGQAPASQEAT